MRNKHFAGRIDWKLNRYDGLDDHILNGLHELKYQTMITEHFGTWTYTGLLQGELIANLPRGWV